MNSVSYQTVSVNKATASKEWVIVDADGQSLGRLCSKVAKLLRGKIAFISSIVATPVVSASLAPVISRRRGPIVSSAK